MPESIVKLGDCMDFMRELPDNYAQLAICDVPYGINRSGQKLSICKNPQHNRKYLKIRNGILKYRVRNTLLNYFEFHAIKFYGAQIIFRNI